jgi:ComF family protein
MIQQALRFAKVAREHALDLLFTRLCLACQAELPEDHRGPALCQDCLEEIPPVDWPVCGRCAAVVPVYPGNVPTCSRCDGDKLRFDSTFSLGHYEGLLKDMVLRMKSDRNEQVGQVLSEIVLDRHGESLRRLDLDAIVPVPMTPWAFLLRRTNPAAVIARRIGRDLGVPVIGRLVERSSYLTPQHVLSRAGRFRNVRGGYRVRRGYRMENPHILLVDDVMTTGATCSEIARILKRAGAARVSVVVIARTPNS